MTSYTEGRKCIIKNISKKAIRRGELGYPPKEHFEGREEPDQLWRVVVTVQEGALPTTTNIKLFNSIQDADTYIAKHPNGSEFQNTLLSDITANCSFDQLAALGFFPMNAGDEDLYLPWKVTTDAQLVDETGISPSMNILDHLGDERVQEIKEKYGENWSAAAEFEYCLKTLPASSPAFIASACRFFYFVLEDDFKAGYLLRDLEVLVHGVEQEAIKARETRERAGKAGSLKSAKAREKRRTDLLRKIEIIASRNPDIAKFGSETVAKVALQECIDNDPALWGQGRGQIDQYLAEIRRGEAGPEMQERYRVIFGNKPPKRL